MTPTLIGAYRCKDRPRSGIKITRSVLRRRQGNDYWLIMMARARSRRKQTNRFGRPGFLEQFRASSFPTLLQFSRAPAILSLELALLLLQSVESLVQLIV